MSLTEERLFDLIDRFLDSGDTQSAYEMLKKHQGRLNVNTGLGMEKY